MPQAPRDQGTGSTAKIKTSEDCGSDCPITLSIVAARPDDLDRSRLEQITQTLARDPAQDAPFAMSYPIVRSSQYTAMTGQIVAWREQKGVVERLPLDENPDGITETLAFGAVLFLSWGRLYHIATKHLQSLNSADVCRSYRLMVTPFGAALVASPWIQIYNDIDCLGTTAAFVPKGLSAHQRLAAERGLAQAIETLIRYENQSYKRANSPRVRVSIG